MQAATHTPLTQVLHLRSRTLTLAQPCSAWRSPCAPRTQPGRASTKRRRSPARTGREPLHSAADILSVGMRLIPHDDLMAMSTLSLPARKALINRDTVETKIQVSLSIDGGPLEHLPSSAHFPERNDKIPHQSEQTHASQSSPSQQIWVWTGIGFLDHMLHALAKHAGWSLRIRSKGDLYSALSYF